MRFEVKIDVRIDVGFCVTIREKVCGSERLIPDSIYALFG